MGIGFSNIADIAAKLQKFWGGDQATGNVLTFQGEGVSPLGAPGAGAGGSEIYGRFHINFTLGLTIAVVSTPTPITGNVTANGTASNTTIQTTLASITYTGALKKLCNLSSVGRLEPVVGGPLLMQFHIAVNGVSVAEGQVQNTSGVVFYEVEITMELNQGDVVSLQGENRTDTTNLEVGKFEGMSGVAGSVLPVTGFLVVAGVG